MHLYLAGTLDSVLIKEISLQRGSTVHGTSSFMISKIRNLYAHMSVLCKVYGIVLYRHTSFSDSSDHPVVVIIHELVSTKEIGGN